MIRDRQRQTDRYRETQTQGHREKNRDRDKEKDVRCMRKSQIETQRSRVAALPPGSKSEASAEATREGNL